MYVSPKLNFMISRELIMGPMIDPRPNAPVVTADIDEFNPDSPLNPSS